jgi:predicted permease
MIGSLRQAVRRLVRAPSFTIVAVATLALGVAVNAAMYAIVAAVGARVFPSVDLSRLLVLRVTNTATNWTRIGILLTEYPRLDASLAPASALAFSDRQQPMTVVGNGRAETVAVEAVGGAYTQLFDLRPTAGRWITADDDRGHARNVAVISARLWQEWYGRDPDIASGAHVTVNGARFAVVGVAADGFHGVDPSMTPPEVWIPEGTLPAVYPRRDPHWFQGHWVTVFLRPRAGVPAAELQTRLSQALSGGLFDRDPAHIRVDLSPALILYADFRWYITMGLALAALVLAAACANVANLFYARAASIRTDLAVRQSLGASFLQLVAPLGAEAAWIGVLASIAGIAAAVAATRAVTALFPVFVVDRVHYSQLSFTADWRMAAYATAAGMAAALVVGIATALVAARRSPMESLCGGGTPAVTPRGRLRTPLAAVQITAALLLVMIAGLVLENEPPELSRRVRFDAASIVGARANLEDAGYDVPGANAFFARLLDRARRVTDAAALASAVPGGSGADEPPIVWVLAPTRNNVGIPRRITASAIAVSPGFFQTLGIPLLRGRVFTQADADGAPLTAVLTKSAAEVLFPGRAAVGGLVVYGFGGPAMTVVGIVDDPVDGPSEHAPNARPSNMIFVSRAQHPSLAGVLLVRADRKAAVQEPIRAIVRGIDDRVGVFGPARLDEAVLGWAAPLRAARLLIVSIAATALAIALLGVYGMLTYFVNVRLREFGIRIALGATRSQVMRLVFDRTIHVLLVGLLCGVLVATLGARVLEHTVVALMPNGLATWAVVPVLILLVGTLAGCLPALRASRVDPMVALRDL